jgi:DNA-binding transcriptional LysR family regulator
MGQQQVPSGTLRISIPTTYAHHRILPLLPAFRARFPAVKVESHISNRNIDFVGEGYDMAIRVRAIPDSGLIARPSKTPNW